MRAASHLRRKYWPKLISLAIVAAAIVFGLYVLHTSLPSRHFGIALFGSNRMRKRLRWCGHVKVSTAEVNMALLK
jgi:hypothetical protein